MKKYQYMNKFFVTLIILLFSCNIVNAKAYKWGSLVKGNLKIDKRLDIKLPPGKWYVIENISDNWGGILLRIIHVGRIENNKLKESISVGRYDVSSIYTSHVDQAIYEMVFKDNHDGCYERPEYYLVEFYQRGSSHNCMVIRHHDTRKELYNPDNPNHRGGNVQLKKYVERNNTEYPPIMLSSSHSYFTRLTGNYWFMLEYNIDPDELGAPISKKTTESSSEYHKGNIDDHPKHKEIMEKWLSISAKKHLEFEEMIQAKSHHLLDLSQYIDGSTSENFGENNLTDELIKLKKLLDDGVITQEEFTKAKKKLLN